MYSNGSRCLSNSKLLDVLDSPPQILTSVLRFNWTSGTLPQPVAYTITWVATEDSSDRGEMVASPSGVHVQGLTPGTEYHFTVLSTILGNDYYNDSIVPTHLTLETLPAPPGKLNESSSNLHTIPYVLRFEPSEGRVAGYNITVGGKSYEVFNPELTVKNLTPDTQYNYTITAYTKHGVGSDDVTGIFKTEPVFPVTSEREQESLNVALVAGVTAASGVVLIVGAVIMRLVIRKRRRNRKPKTFIDSGRHEIVMSRPSTAAASPAKTDTSEFMDTNVAAVYSNVNKGEVDGKEYNYIYDSPAGSWQDDTYEYLTPTVNADNLDGQDVENIYNNVSNFGSRP